MDYPLDFWEFQHAKNSTLNSHVFEYLKKIARTCTVVEIVLLQITYS